MELSFSKAVKLVQSIEGDLEIMQTKGSLDMQSKITSEMGELQSQIKHLESLASREIVAAKRQIARE